MREDSPPSRFPINERVTLQQIQRIRNPRGNEPVPQTRCRRNTKRNYAASFAAWTCGAEVLTNPSRTHIYGEDSMPADELVPHAWSLARASLASWLPSPQRRLVRGVQGGSYVAIIQVKEVRCLTNKFDGKRCERQSHALNCESASAVNKRSTLPPGHNRLGL